MHLLLSGLDRTSTKGLVFVDKHARHGVLNALVTRPIWVFRCCSLMDTSLFFVLDIGKEQSLDLAR